MSGLGRLHVLLPALWTGMLLTVGLLAAPATFAVLAPSDAGRVVAPLFAGEAWTSSALALVLVMLERRRGGPPLGAEVLLPLGALFCTVAGYFALQPLMSAARAGQGAWSFGQLHAASLAFFALKGVLVAVLAWRCAGRAALRLGATS